MSKVFVIPDIHLKPWVFDRAEEYLSKTEYDQIVCLGDLEDDWGMEEMITFQPIGTDRRLETGDLSG